MTPAAASLLALLLAILLSCFTRLNVGLVGFASAWVIATGLAGWKPEALLEGFPSSLFVTLVGVSLLFALAEENGTLARLTEGVFRRAGGQARVLPWLFFGVAALLSAMGPGAILAAALVAPVAMPLARRAGLPPLLAALLVGNGANAGNLSPFSYIGVIANTKMALAGITHQETKVFLANFLAHLLVSIGAFILFGRASRRAVGDVPVERTAWNRHHWLTLGVIAAWIAAVVVWRWNLGLAAMAAATVLIVLRAGDEAAAVRRVPWSVILMVTGMSLLIFVLERTGGMDLFTGLLARIATPATVNGMIAFVTGLISTYSSTSGVVLPTFLPAVPGLLAKVGGGDALAVSLSINVGSALVDVSPLSTIGALCVAAADASVSRDLFRQLLIWGLLMTVVGAVLCQALAGPLARW
jgi:di/tricarboxylate transporter